MDSIQKALSGALGRQPLEFSGSANDGSGQSTTATRPNGGDTPVSIEEVVEELGDLRSQIPVTAELPLIDLDAARAAAKAGSEAVFGSATDYFNLRRQINELTETARQIVLAEGGENTPQYRLVVAELNVRQKEKLRIETNLKKHSAGRQKQFWVDVFIVEINHLQPTSDREVEEMILYTLNWDGVGRAQEATTDQIGKYGSDLRNWPKPFLFFLMDSGKKYYLLPKPSKQPGMEGQITGTDRKIFAALGGLKNRFIAFRQQERDKRAEERAQEPVKVAELMALPDEDFLDITQLRTGQPGIYRFFIPARDQRDQDSAGIVEVVDINRAPNRPPHIVIRAVNGAGFCKGFRTHKGKEVRLWVYDYYVTHRRQLPSQVQEDEREFTEEFCWRLYLANQCARHG
ncbi:MAG: hypothetical protein NTX55_00910, partial [Candidatus Parcubacteria bacterium]|nr:hypothetical protein [Candidatus Parcubacteria bacterium]